MINISSTQDLRLPLFYIWLILMLYGFYKYYKRADFKNISLKHFMLASFIIFWCGYITLAMFFGIEHLHLLPFMPLGILTLAKWWELNSIALIAGCLLPPTLLPMIYSLLVKMYQEVFNTLRCPYDIAVARFVLRRRFVVFIRTFMQYILINYEKNYVSSPAISAQDGL